jgi:protein-arginine kinase activator protein McsA
MICEVCKIRQATMHGMAIDAGNGAGKRLRHFCSDCFEESRDLDITRPEEVPAVDISEDT